MFNLIQCAAEYGDLSRNFRQEVRDSTKPGRKGEKARKATAQLFAGFGRSERYVSDVSCRPGRGFD
jgi:hypothetical protein